MRTTSADQAAAREYDFIVVGGGSAGCALAARLSECRDVTVCLLEAGQDDTRLDSRIPIACGNLQKSDVDWAYYTEADGEHSCKGLAEHKSFWPRGKGLGGSSHINYMAYVRGCRDDFDNWARMGADGWCYDEVLPYFKKAEGCTSVGNAYIDGHCHGTDGPLTTTVMDPPRTLAAKFLQSAERLGFKLGDYNAGTMDNTAGLFAHTIRNGERCDTRMAYLVPAADRPNLTIVTRAHAARLVWNTSKTKIQGVRVIDQSTKACRTVELRCSREVIVCCGAIDTPKLLMLSGIGPRQHLESVGVECLKDLPVGRHLEDHIANLISFPVSGCDSVSGKRAEGFPEALVNLYQWLVHGSGIFTTSAYDATLFYKTPEFHESHPHHGPDVQIAIFATPGNDKVFEGNFGLAPNFLKGSYEPHMDGYILVPTLLHPHSTGRVELRDSDPQTPPKIISNYLTDKRDIKTAVESYRKCVELARASGLGEVSGSPILPQDLVDKYGGGDSEDFWEEYARRTGTTLYHPACTAKIGAVVDPQLQVYGIPGLRVADASVWPTVTSGNTNAPAIMVGEKAADLIKARYDLKSHIVTTAPPARSGAGMMSLLAPLLVMGIAWAWMKGGTGIVY